MAALVAIPAVAVPVAAIPTEAADVTPEQLVYTIDGQTFTIAYADYQDTLFDSESALAQLIADQTPVAIAVGDVYVDYTKYQDILFEGELEGIEALTAAVADETTHVAEEDQEGFDTTVEFDEDGNPVFNEPEPEKADLTAYNKAVAEAEALVEADYTAESYAVLAEALAVEITEESTQEEVDAAVAAINEAVAALVEAPVADTEAPVITVDTTAITVENGATLTIPTATATDNVDKTVEVTQTIKNAAGETVTAIDTKVAGTYTVTYTAVDAAGNEAEAKTVTVTVKAVGLAVESVSAINAKQVTLTFNTELDEKTVTKAAFTVTQTNDATGKDRLTNTANSTNGVTGADVNTGSVQLSADKKSVTITVDNNATFTNPTTVTVKVANTVKDVNGNAVAETTKTAELKDATVPTISSIESVGKDTIRVIFTEPVTTTNDLTTGTGGKKDTGLNAGLLATSAFVIDNFSYAVTSVDRDAKNPNALLVKTSATIPAGEHKVKINPATATQTIKDYAGYAVVPTEVAFTQVTDATAPTFTAVTKSEDTVRLTFNRPVTFPATGTNVELRAGYDALNAPKQTVTSANAVAGSNNTQYDVKFSAPLNPGVVNLYLSYASTVGLTDANTVVDSYGNRLPSGTTTTVNVVADTVAPSITAVKNTDTTTVEVSFSEAVAKADVASNFKLVDSKGKEYAISTSTVKPDTNDLTYILKVASLENGGSFTLTANDQITDNSVAKNKLTNATFNFAVADLKAPTIAAGAVTINDNKDKIYVEFSEPVIQTGVNSATDITNYRFHNAGTFSALPTGTTITANGNVVTINLPATINTTTYPQLAIGQVADLAGNKTVALQTIETINVSTGWAVTTQAKDVKVLNRETVEFKVNRQLTAIDATKISLIGGAGTAASATFVNNTDGTATITAKFAKDTITTDLSNVTDLALAAGAFTDTNTLKSAAPANIVKDATGTATDWDKVATEFVALASKPVTIKDGNDNGFLDTVTLTFTETLYTQSVQDADFTVEGYTIKSVNTSTPNTVIITLNERTTSDLTATPTVTVVGQIEDVKRNVAGPIAGIKAENLHPAALASTAITIAADTAGTNAGKTMVNTATTNEYRVVSATGTQKQAWTQGTGSLAATTANVVAGDKIEVRVKAAGPLLAGAVSTHTVVEGNITLPATPLVGAVTITQGTATGKAGVDVATTLEYRVTDAAGTTVKQDWTTGTGSAVDTTATVVATDKIEVRVKAVTTPGSEVPASASYTHDVVAGNIGA